MYRLLRENPFLSALALLINFLVVVLFILLVNNIVALAETVEAPQARGVVRALTEATIAVDYTARVEKLPVLEGEAFKRGQILIGFDCRRYNSEVVAARAGAHAAELV